MSKSTKEQTWIRRFAPQSIPTNFDILNKDGLLTNKELRKLIFDKNTNNYVEFVFPNVSKYYDHNWKSIPNPIIVTDLGKDKYKLKLPPHSAIHFISEKLIYDVEIINGDAILLIFDYQYPFYSLYSISDEVTIYLDAYPKSELNEPYNYKNDIFYIGKNNLSEYEDFFQKFYKDDWSKIVTLTENSDIDVALLCKLMNDLYHLEHANLLYDADMVLVPRIKSSKNKNIIRLNFDGDKNPLELADWVFDFIYLMIWLKKENQLDLFEKGEPTDKINIDLISDNPKFNERISGQRWFSNATEKGSLMESQKGVLQRANKKFRELFPSKNNEPSFEFSKGVTNFTCPIPIDKIILAEPL